MKDKLLTDNEEELDALLRQSQEEQERQYQQLRHNAQSVFRAFGGWEGVKSKKGWLKTLKRSREAYRSGRFLIERLGAELYLDPELIATLWQQRQGLLEEYKVESPAEMMLADLTVLAYYNGLRAQGWIGNLALLIEHEFFGQESLTVKSRLEGGRGADSLKVEEAVRRMVEQLIPLLDRANRMVIRNLKAIKELGHGRVPDVTIGQATQVNVANRQANAAIKRSIRQGVKKSRPRKPAFKT